MLKSLDSERVSELVRFYFTKWSNSGIGKVLQPLC